VIILEKMVILIVDNETKAYDAAEALEKLDAQGDITVYGDAVIGKKADGKVEVKKTGEGFPIKMLGGTAIGSLIGLLGGPIGVIVGAAAGTAVGGFSDLYSAGVSADFVDEASAKLTPGKFAVVADISEEWVTPLDTEMEKLGASVIRTPKRDVETEQRKQDQATTKDDIKKLKIEASKSRDENKVKLQKKIDGLEKKLQNQKEQATQRSEAIKKEQDAKVQALQKKAETSQGETKKALRARIGEIRESYEKSKEKWEKLQLEKATERYKKTEAKLEKLEAKKASA
jgi:uncharacterized membrane protein